MKPAPFALVADLALDPANAWSIGSFGAIGEFMRDQDEPARIVREDTVIEIVTGRGGIRIVDADLAGLAWDTLSKDGETWGHAMAFCAPVPAPEPRVIRALGSDTEALREDDRGAKLFDLGVGHGCVRMALRTGAPVLIDALQAAEGKALLEQAGVMPLVLAHQPHRVLISPAGRIEVYQPIPLPDGKSPEGPHTHLLPKLIAKDRPHSSNTPIPQGWQAALNMHPKSPWRTVLGERHPYEPETDAAFQPLLERFAVPEDVTVERTLRADLGTQNLTWPETRRGRHKARIVLRRLHAAGDDRVQSWRALHDRATLEDEEDAGPAA
ncbi:hypothetical protein [Novosphingobium sp. P6W]|uniref:DUF6925 family protein n=1 Tax=Novosphingobium sp. P6W TaxID=1609758 RepID=UPI0005C446E5|nr:hypothetical protein [Novosphingobium sp. P6W]AXB80204.1 hypothetical protein TQ38_026805 [Novosphingobium sp. P6W]